MDSMDARTRGKIHINPSGSLNSSLVINRRLLADILLVIVLNAGKDYLMYDTGVFWVLVRILACGGLTVMVWLVASGQLQRKQAAEWSVVGMSSLLLFLRHAGLLTALYRLPSTRVILFTHFSPIWFKSLTSFTSVKRTSAIFLSLAFSFLWDTAFVPSNFRSYLPAYGALAVHALSATALEHTDGILSSSLGQSMSAALSILGACVFSLPLYLLRHILVGDSTHRMPTLAALAVLPCLAYVLLYYNPRASVSTNIAITSPRFIVSSYLTTFASATVLGYLAFGHAPKLLDFLIFGTLLYGMYPRITEPSASASTYYATTSRLMRAYLKDILSNPESRKIFYFLMLNMCYMLVQMLYGIWTNSLGLISDAIHMAFDCMAIGVGLIASVMARWPPNERFTYGYGRIETLSGFANGIFLILISVFIVFEAIQRLLDPPEMNTSQLLLVSSLGLGVNLFGMFAMGGHHHGGHSHSHGHSHGPSVPPTPLTATMIHDHDHSHSLDDHGHSHGHDDHNHSHSHDHGHGPTLSHIEPSCPSPGSPSYSHSHTHTHTQPPPTSDAHEHAHSHSQTSASAHSHSHTHSHPASHPDDTPAPGRHLDLVDVPSSPSSPHHSPTSPHASSHAHAHTHAQAHLAPDGAISPLTPSYRFGHDAHFETHHAHSAPNLHDHSHVHDHAHEGHSTTCAATHPLIPSTSQDTLGSVGVIVSTLLIQLYGWTGFDPIASLFIAILIAASVVPLVIDTGKVLALDLDTREKSIQGALSELAPIEGLASYTTPRFWPKDSASIIGTIHIQLAHSASPAIRAGRTRTSSDRVDKLLRSRIPGLEELTIQVEESSSL
ncbi:cation efflux family-domain-containing protein [Trametes gibbosa]|nr:cation efflux family-domain-containing protein [Trametes gibbosa]